MRKKIGARAEVPKDGMRVDEIAAVLAAVPPSAKLGMTPSAAVTVRTTISGKIRSIAVEWDEEP